MTDMRYGTLPGLDKPVSRLIQGTVMVNSAEQERSFRLLDEVFALGCTAFDTAHVYGDGDNERTVGRWVRERGLRDRVVIIAKGAHHNADRQRVTPFDISADLHDSARPFRVRHARPLRLAPRRPGGSRRPDYQSLKRTPKER